MAVNISATYTKDEKPFDGLAAIEHTLIREPMRRYTVVAVVERSGMNTDDRKGTVTPRIRFAAIEVLTDEKDVKAVREMLDARFRDRTGRDDALPDDLFSTRPDPEPEAPPTPAEDDPTAGPFPGEAKR